MGKTALYILVLAGVLIIIGSGILWSLVARPILVDNALAAADWRTLPTQSCVITSVQTASAPDYFLGPYIRIGCAGADGVEDARDYAIPAEFADSMALASHRNQTAMLRLVDDSYGPIGPSKTLPRWIVSMAANGQTLVSGERLHVHYRIVMKPTLGGIVLFAILGVGAILPGLAIVRWAARKPA